MIKSNNLYPIFPVQLPGTTFMMYNQKTGMKKLIVLAVAGVAIKLFLDSPQGNQLKGKVRDLIQEAQDKINEWLETAAEKVENTASRVDQAVADKVLS